MSTATAEKLPVEIDHLEDECWNEEDINGIKMMSSRPKGPHTHFASRLHTRLDGPFGGPPGEGEEGPGGWWIYFEPELKLPPGEKVAPDLCGWHIERLPYGYEGDNCLVAPDWICEVLSTSTRKWDRETKMPLYAKHRIGHIWLVDPIERQIEAYAIGRRGFEQIGIYSEGRVSIEPFEAVALDLGRLWPPRK